MDSHQSFEQDGDDSVSYLEHLKYDEILFELCDQVKYIVNEIQAQYSELHPNATVDLSSKQKRKLKLAIIGDIMNSQYEVAKEKIKELKQLNEQQSQENMSLFDDGWDQALLEVCLRFEQLQRSNENTNPAAMQVKIELDDL